MPSGKTRDLDDTWKKDELEKTLKETRRHDKDRDKRHRDEDSDRRHRRKEDDDRRRHRDKENGDPEKKHRSSRHKEEDDRERRHRRHKAENGDSKDDDAERRQRRHKDREGEEDKHRRHKDDDDRERRHRRHRDEHDEYDDGEKKNRKHREDETEEERRKRKERERRHREENGDDRHRRRDDDRERRHRSDRDGDDRKHRSDRDGEDRKHRSDRHRSDKDGDRKDRDDDEERKRRHEEKRRRDKDRERKEKDSEREKENTRQREKDHDREREMEREQEKQREREKRREKDREERKAREEQKRAERKKEEEEQDIWTDFDPDSTQDVHSVMRLMNATYCVKNSDESLKAAPELSLDDIRFKYPQPILNKPVSELSHAQIVSSSDDMNSYQRNSSFSSKQDSNFSKGPVGFEEAHSAGCDSNGIPLAKSDSDPKSSLIVDESAVVFTSDSGKLNIVTTIPNCNEAESSEMHSSERDKNDSIQAARQFTDTNKMFGSFNRFLNESSSVTDAAQSPTSKNITPNELYRTISDDTALPAAFVPMHLDATKKDEIQVNKSASSDSANLSRNRNKRDTEDSKGAEIAVQSNRKRSKSKKHKDGESVSIKPTKSVLEQANEELIRYFDKPSSYEKLYQNVKVRKKSVKKGPVEKALASASENYDDIHGTTSSERKSKEGYMTKTEKRTSKGENAHDFDPETNEFFDSDRMNMHRPLFNQEILLLNHHDYDSYQHVSKDKKIRRKKSKEEKSHKKKTHHGREVKEVSDQANLKSKGPKEKELRLEGDRLEPDETFVSSKIHTDTVLKAQPNRTKMNPYETTLTHKSRIAPAKQTRSKSESKERREVEIEPLKPKQDFHDVYSQKFQAVVSDKHTKLNKAVKAQPESPSASKSPRFDAKISPRTYAEVANGLKTEQKLPSKRKKMEKSSQNQNELSESNKRDSSFHIELPIDDDNDEGDDIEEHIERFDPMFHHHKPHLSPKSIVSTCGSSLKQHDVHLMETIGTPRDSMSSHPDTSKTSPVQVSMATDTNFDSEPAGKGEEEENGGDDYGDYEDDFEDYDDDFEDDDEEEESKPAAPKIEGQHSMGYYKSLDWDVRSASRAEVDLVKQAMDEENERLMRESKQKQNYDSDDSFEEHRPTRSRYEDDDEPKKSWGRPKTAGRSFINFTVAKQRQLTSQVAGKARRRAMDLAHTLELDIARFDIFDMPPVSEYELYMRTFGGSDTKQAYIQTNEDNIEREIQTEEIEVTEKWSQHPPEDLECVGGPDEDKKSEEDALKPIDQVKLNKFLQNAAQTMIYLIEEDRAAMPVTQSNKREHKSEICLSEAFSELAVQAQPLLKGRQVTCSYFSPSQSHILLTMHSPPPPQDVNSTGILCVWNVNEPQAPQKLLMSESRPRCCCFSPIKSHLAFAGMHDGSLAVWDLREAASLHTVKAGCTHRYPTYSTAGVLQYDNHQSPVTALQPIVAQLESSSGSLGGLGGDVTQQGDNLNFQLISLEENCTINLWVVAEIGHPDSAGSMSELGLSPGGRVKLLKSSVITLQNPLRDPRLRATMRSYSMCLLPSNNSHFYVSTNVGCVLHGVRYGGKAPPSVYWTEQTESLSKITSIDFSPFSEPVFLTGSEDGTLRLHHIDCDHALIAWPNATQGAPIQSVRWCRSRPSVFFVLDSQARMHIWDLFMSDAVPMKQERIADEPITSFELSNDHSATGQGMPGRKPQMVVCLESGSAEVHTVSREFSALMPEEIQQFSNLILTYT